MSATVISFEDFNKSKSESIEQTAIVSRRPVSVLVHWSESGDFEKETLYPFADFECKALSSAFAHAGGGYLKTKITVNFDDGETYACRVDLAAHDELGFQHHVLQMIEFSNTDKGRAAYAADDWQALLNFVKTIDFDTSAASIKENEKLGIELDQIAKAAEKAAEQAAKEAADAEAEALILAMTTDPEFSHLAQIGYYADAVAVAKNIRADLKKHFKGCKFSVRKSTSGAIYINWTDGPTRKAVDNIVNRYKAGSFDTMSDCYEFADSCFSRNFGSVSYVFTSRHTETARELAELIFKRDGLECDSQEAWELSNELSEHGGAWTYEGKPLDVDALRSNAKPLAAPMVEFVAQEKPKFKAVNLGGSWRVDVSLYADSGSYSRIAAASAASANRAAWALFVADFAPFGPLPQLMIPNPKDSAAVPDLVSLDAARENQDAERAAHSLIGAALSADFIPYYSAAIAALAVYSSKIVRFWADENRREIVDRETLIGAAGRVRFSVERLSTEITRLIDDSITYDLYHGKDSGALVAAVEAESAHNLKIKEQNAAPFAAAFAAFTDGIEQRRERLEQRAARVSAESDRRYQMAHNSASAIPFGQPILVGHHSERADRNRRARIHDNFGKAFALADKAEYLAEKAESIGSGGISSADPSAVLKLTEKLEALEKSQNMMKQANAAIRTGNLEKLPELGLSQSNIDELLNPRHSNRKGFQPWALQNNNANIKRVKDRIREIALTQQPSTEEPTIHGIAKRDLIDGRVCFYFEDKPPEDVRKLLRSYAFNWAPSRKAWVRKATANGLHAGKVIAKKLEDLYESV